MSEDVVFDKIYRGVERQIRGSQCHRKFVKKIYDDMSDRKPHLYMDSSSIKLPYIGDGVILTAQLAYQDKDFNNLYHIYRTGDFLVGILFDSGSGSSGISENDEISMGIQLEFHGDRGCDDIISTFKVRDPSRIQKVLEDGFYLPTGSMFYSRISIIIPPNLDYENLNIYCLYVSGNNIGDNERNSFKLGWHCCHQWIVHDKEYPGYYKMIRCMSGMIGVADRNRYLVDQKLMSPDDINILEVKCLRKYPYKYYGSMIYR